MDTTLFDMDKTLFFKMNSTSGHSWIIAVPFEHAINTNVPDGLIDVCAQKVAEGYVVSQVVQLMPDGRTPRVPVLTSKKFKHAYANYLAMRRTGEKNPFIDQRPASTFSAIDIASVYEAFFDELADTVLSPNSQWLRSTFTDTAEQYSRWASAFRGKPALLRAFLKSLRMKEPFSYSKPECMLELKKLFDYAYAGINDREFIKEMLADCGMSLDLYQDLCKIQTPRFCNESTVDFIKDAFPAGGRILLISMNDPYDPVPSGMTGVIDCVDDACQIHVKWDNGRTLAVVPDVDLFMLI